MTRYLDYETVVAINLEYCGIGAGAIDKNGILGALAQLEQGIGQREFYPTLWDKAAVLLRGLAATQYFSDGNKRTAVLSADAFLEANGLRLKVVDPDESEHVVRRVAAGNASIPETAQWYRSICKRTPFYLWHSLKYRLVDWGNVRDENSVIHGERD